MVKTGSTMLLWIIIVGLLAGCALQPTAQEPEQAQPPHPERLLISSGNTVQSLEPGDLAYRPVAEALDNLVAGIDARARTFYTAENFEEVFGQGPYLEAIYHRDVELSGKGIEIVASHLVVAFPDGDMVILTRPEADTGWAVYLSSDIARFDALLQAVSTQTGTDLQTSRP